jgi:hypothetical protein
MGSEHNAACCHQQKPSVFRRSNDVHKGWFRNEKMFIAQIQIERALKHVKQLTLIQLFEQFLLVVKFKLWPTISGLIFYYLGCICFIRSYTGLKKPAVHVFPKYN